MSDFINLCTTLIGGCASLFDIPFPGLGGITFFQVFTGIFIASACISGLKIVFGIDHSGDST